MASKPRSVRPTAGEIKFSHQLEAAHGNIQRLEQAVIAIGRRLVLAEQRLANRDGYIERVWDVEQSQSDAAPTDEHGAVADLRRLIANGPDKLASSLIEVIPPELMERVLGGPNEGGF